MAETTYTFHVAGMHCTSCVLLTENELGDVPGIIKVKASLHHHQVAVTGNFGEQTPEALLAILKPVMIKHGYLLALEKQAPRVNWSEFSTALPLAGIFMAAFIILQKLGIVNLVGGGEVSYPTVFLIGIIASLSTCMAIVGGLVLSMSASFAKEGDTVRPQVLFHVGRLVSFFVLGGAIGVLGSVFRLGGTGTFILGIFVALVMFVLGLNLLDIFHWTKNYSQPCHVFFRSIFSR